MTKTKKKSQKEKKKRIKKKIKKRKNLDPPLGQDQGQNLNPFLLLIKKFLKFGLFSLFLKN